LFVAEGVKAKVYFRAQAHHVKGRTFLQVEDMKLDFSVKDIKMGIENLHNGNAVLRKCLATWQSFIIILKEDVLLPSAGMTKLNPVSKHQIIVALYEREYSASYSGHIYPPIII
jgi:hypothetical protein